MLAARQTSRRSVRPTAYAPARRSDGAPLPRGNVLTLPIRRIARVQPRRERRPWRDTDAVVALVVLWVASAIRVAGAFARHEVFGAEASLAFLSLVLAPFFVLRGRGSR